MKKNHPVLSFVHSEEMLDNVLELIPLGSQTFSKSHVTWPRGAAPLFAASGSGAHLTDVDGNVFVDFVNGLAAVTLGYADKDVDAAVQAQMRQGAILSLPHPVEAEVAAMIIERVPCAEKVRFGKNGSDTTAGAIRAARAFTGRDRVAVCGYHGWQDWYIGSTARDRGVPRATSELTHTFTYNDLPGLEKTLAEHPGEFAAIILEPMNVEWPREGFLEGLKELAGRHGAVLIFDETITGFRYARGGAQEFFGVTPDLATFGKGLANGYPLSAVAGRADIMQIFEEVFFSFTMGGETLSLAAAKAAMEKADREDAFGHFRVLGERLLQGMNSLIEAHGCGAFLHTAGHPAWPFLLIGDGPDGISSWELMTLWLQETIARGYLCLGNHNLSLSHTMADIEGILAVYDEVFAIMKAAVDTGNVTGLLRCQPLEPLFRVR